MTQCSKEQHASLRGAERVDAIKSCLRAELTPYADIAQRHGVSREYVRQIAHAIGVNGEHRRRNYRQVKLYDKFDPTRLTEAALVAWSSAEQRGLTLLPHYRRTSEGLALVRACLIVNGRLCLVRRARTRSFGGGACYAMTKKPHADRLRGVEFVLIVVDLCRVLVLPVSALGESMYIRPAPPHERPRPLGRAATTDWLAYEDAWSQIKKTGGYFI